MQKLNGATVNFVHCSLCFTFSASTAMQFRERKVEDAANLIENNLMLLGATAIEDKLQEGIATLHHQKIFDFPQNFFYSVQVYLKLLLL